MGMPKHNSDFGGDLESFVDFLIDGPGTPTHTAL